MNKHNTFCKICFEDIYHKVSLLSYFSYKDVICEGCRSKMQEINKWKQIDTLNVYCIYAYDTYMENLMFQFKEGRDIALKDVFLYTQKKKIEKMFKDYTIIFMPSSKEHTKIRGFIPLEEMFLNINLNKENILEKKGMYKQSVLSYAQRKQVKNCIKMKKGCKKHRGKVLLVDDVMTSGETLLSAYALLKDDCEEIKALIVCDNHKDVELCDEKKFPFYSILYILKK